MFCVLRILHRCVFRSKSFYGFPGSLPDKPDPSGDCQTLESFRGSFGGSRFDLPVFLDCKRDQYNKHVDFFPWDHPGDGTAGLRPEKGKRTAYRLFDLLAGLLTCWGISFLLGGLLYALPLQAGKGILIFFTITFTAYLILDTGIRLFKYLKGKAVSRCRVILELGGQKMELEGLLDTGNCLTDSNTGKPVCVMEMDRFSSMLEKKQRAALESFCGLNSTGGEDLGGLNPRFVFYTALGCEKGLLPVVTADRLVIFWEERKISIPQAAIGLSAAPLSPYRKFEMIISPKILDS